MTALLMTVFLSISAEAKPKAVEPVVKTCSQEVRGFYLKQLKYENAKTQDEKDNVAAEIEAQYSCDLNVF